MSANIFKPYDIRGKYGKDFSKNDCYKIGRILAKMLSVKKAVIGKDVTNESSEIHRELIEGLLDEGVLVYDLGLSSVESVYFTVAELNCDLGLEATASHATDYLSGIKICGQNATPFAQGSGMENLRENFLNYKEMPPKNRGKLEEINILPNFIKKTISFTNPKKIRPFKIIADASNSVGALGVNELEKALPQIRFQKINWEQDGKFPGHPPNPFLEENRIEISKKIKKEKADMGMIFDGDADRIYFLDEKGEYIFGVYINGLLVEKIFRNKFNKNKVALYDIRALRYIKEKIKKMGGVPELCPIGHSFFKDKMRQEKAIFGGESSGHIYYNLGNYYGENSLLAFCQVLEILSEKKTTLRKITLPIKKKYPVSGEWNFTIPGFKKNDEISKESLLFAKKVLKTIRKHNKKGEITNFDTLSVFYENWNFNIRPSANETILRYNGEASDKKTLKKRQKKLFQILKSEGCKYINDSGVKLA